MRLKEIKFFPLSEKFLEKLEESIRKEIELMAKHPEILEKIKRNNHLI